MKHLFAILLLFFSCLAFGQNKDAYEVTGNFFDTDGRPLEGVAVTLTSDSVRLCRCLHRHETDRPLGKI